MESALSSIILFTVGLFAAMTITHTFLETQDALWTAEQTRQEAMLERDRTNIEIIGAEPQGDGSIVNIKVRNSGQVKLAEFAKWDVVVQYYSDGEEEDDPDLYHIEWLPYSNTPNSLQPGNLQWSVSGIYADVQGMRPEVFEPGILNPDESMIIQAQLTPSVAMTTTNRIIVNTENGISTSAHFMR